MRHIEQSPAPSPLDGWVETIDGPASEHRAFSLREAHRAFKKKHGLTERKGSSIAEHHILSVSREWIEQFEISGNDPNNHLIPTLMDAAKDWANEALGGALGNSVFAVRYDLDERGTAKVDVYTAPAAYQAHGPGGAKGKAGRKQKLRISVRAAQMALQHSYGDEYNRSYSAAQTSWHAFACKRLAHQFELPTRKTTEGNDRTSPEEYRRKEELDHREQVVAGYEKRLAVREQAVLAREEKVRRRGGR